MKYRVNDVTGLPEYITTGKLVGVGNQVKELNNEKRTQYRTGVVELEITNESTGEIIKKTTWCNIYEKNFQNGMELGQKYEAVITKMEDGSKLVTLSNQAHIEKLTDDLFDFDKATASEVIEEKVAVFSK